MTKQNEEQNENGNIKYNTKKIIVFNQDEKKWNNT